MVDEYYAAIYIKPYTRIGPYLVGMFLGYVLFVSKGKTHLTKVSFLRFSEIRFARLSLIANGATLHHEVCERSDSVKAPFTKDTDTCVLERQSATYATSRSCFQ